MKQNKKILIILCLFFVISIISIYSSLKYVSDQSIIYKQIIFYFIGFISIYFITKTKNNLLIKYSFILFIIGNFLLVLVLIIGTPINGSKAWISIPKIGTIQPSEFMKIALILFNAKIIDKHNTKKKHNFKNDLLLIIKLFIITIIPTILTFLEPDTGAVIMYFIIMIAMLYLSEINNYWFYTIIITIILLISGLLYLYFLQQDLFISVLGNSFFYRLDRIINWLNGTGMQLENSLISIGSAGWFGQGINNIKIYYPFPATDFIFASFTTCFGLIGGIGLIILIIAFDIELLNKSFTAKNNIDKYIIIGTLAVIIYQQIQNIAMTIGLLPITGITLPFISYGGSSLLSYMILIGIIINTNKKMH